MKFMALILYIILLSPALAFAQTIADEMQPYCSAPPFVTRYVAPNIMILMDNSQDMMGPAYEDSYTPNATKDNYSGYFIARACYKYGSNSFEEVYKTNTVNIGGDQFGVSYTHLDDCPSSAPFRGNLLNWATTSKFDLLQKVLIGGNSASKQGNAHTLVSIGGTWSKTPYSGCSFDVSSGNLYVRESVTGACGLLLATPSPIAFWEKIPYEKIAKSVLNGLEAGATVAATSAKYVLAQAVKVWDRIEIVKNAYAAQLVISPQSAWNGTVGTPYAFTLEGSGCNNCTYTWTFSPSPPAPWLSGPTYATQGNKANYRVTWSGTPSAAGTYTFSVTLSSAGHTSVTNSYGIVIANPPLSILTSSLLEAEQNAAYSFTMQGIGGTPPYTWSAVGLPAGITINATTGVISGISATKGTYAITITLKDNSGVSGSDTVTRAYSFIVSQKAKPLEQLFNIKVKMVEEPLVDKNGNGTYDANVLGESYTDANGNLKWDGKQGVFNKFWDENNPKARWGMTKFGKQGNTVIVDIDSCIPASPASSFYTRIQNATATDVSPLAKGLAGVINYFMFNGQIYKGCNNSDAIDNVPCRKNFILTLTSGADVSGDRLESATGCGQTENLVHNACFGYNTDLRPDASTTPPGKQGKQIAYTYVVNTTPGGGANAQVLKDAAAAGNGKYYEPVSYSSLESQIVQAIQDILAQAASGTAVSVLTTSSRGVGSVIQAYFLPSKLDGTRDIRWTGYMQNIWIDPNDYLREDSVADKLLKLDDDKVMKLYLNPITKETEVALFTTDANGAGGQLASCSAADPPQIKPFRTLSSLWEAGEKLSADQAASSRTIFTSKKVNRSGTEVVLDSSSTVFEPAFTTGMSDPLKNALNPEPDGTGIYTFDKIVRYIRGEDIEGADLVNFRDRRVTIGGSLKVWKLGDIISSTPKVLANVPVNAYHNVYGDKTYYDYVSSDTVKKRTSTAFVGANDGMLHAFRVGYLKDTGLSAGIKALFSNSATTSANDRLGEELWGYIPFNAFPYLKYLLSTGYCHIYYNDLSVTLVDVSVEGGPSATKNGSTWRTLLIGGMRFGGACGTNGAPALPPSATPANIGYSSYYALDVTNPEAPRFLWEFSDDDMGYATTLPAILRTGDTSLNGYWYVAVGSGSKVLPTSGIDIGRSTTGYVYILDIMTGTQVKKIDLGHNGIVGDILATDVNWDYNSEKIYFGTSYLSGATWRGKVMSVTIPKDQDLSSGWTPSVRTMIDGPYPFTASPEATKDEYGKIWVYAGSGKYFSDMDEEDSSQQIFFGMKDDTAITYPMTEGSAVASCPATCPTGSLCDVSTCQTTGTVTSTVKVCAYNGSTFSLQDVVTSIAGTSIAPKSNVGWKIYLPFRERVISAPLAVGGIVDFLTYKPTGDACSYGGTSYIYAVDYTSGVAPTNVALRAPGATSGTSGTVTVPPGYELGPGAPPTGRAIIIPPQKEGQNKLKKKIQVATGVIVEAENKPIIDAWSKVIHWMKK